MVRTWIIAAFCILASIEGTQGPAWAGALPQATIDAALAFDWQKTASVITADDSLTGDPAARLLAAHAYLAINKNNAAMLLFASLRGPGAAEAGLKWAKNLAATHPKNAVAAYLLGDALARSGQYAAGISAFDRALDLAPKFALALNARGVAKVAADQQDGGLMDFAHAAQLDPKLADACANQGALFLFQENGEGARNAFAKAIEADPSFALAYNGLACAEFAEGEYDKSLADLEKAYDVCPGFLPAGVNEAIVLAAQAAEASPKAKSAGAGTTLTVKTESGAVNLMDRPSLKQLDTFEKSVERMSNLGEAFRTVSAQRATVHLAQQDMVTNLQGLQGSLKAANDLERMFRATDTVLSFIPTGARLTGIVPGSSATWKTTLDLAGHGAGFIARTTQPGTGANMVAEVVSRSATLDVFTGLGFAKALTRVVSYIGQEAMYVPKTIAESKIGELCAKQQWGNVVDARLNGLQGRLLARGISEGFDFSKLSLVRGVPPISTTVPGSVRVYPIAKDAPITQFGVLPSAIGKHLSATSRPAFVLVEGGDKTDALRLGRMLGGCNGFSTTLPVPRGMDGAKWAGTLGLVGSSTAVVRIQDTATQRYALPSMSSTGPPPGGVTTEFRPHIDRGNWPVLSTFLLAYTASPNGGLNHPDQGSDQSDE